MQCIQCQHANRDTAKFCEECGTSLIASTSTSYSSPAIQHRVVTEGRFYAFLSAVATMLQREKRVTYRSLKHIFGLDDVLLAEIGEELSFRRLARDEDGKGLVWTGEMPATVPSTVIVSSQPDVTAPPSVSSSAAPKLASLVTEPSSEIYGSTISPEGSLTGSHPDESVATPEPVRSVPEAERRQLTVMFCDLVGSTDLSGKRV